MWVDALFCELATIFETAEKKGRNFLNTPYILTSLTYDYVLTFEQNLQPKLIKAAYSLVSVLRVDLSDIINKINTILFLQSKYRFYI